MTGGILTAIVVVLWLLGKIGVGGMLLGIGIDLLPIVLVIIFSALAAIFATNENR